MTTNLTVDADARQELLQALVQRRRDCGLRQVDVAARMGVGQPSISELERGEVSPRLSTLQRYARAVDAELEFVIAIPAEGSSGGRV